MRLLIEYVDRWLGRRARRVDTTIEQWAAKREGRMGLALFLFGIGALVLAGMLLATVRL